ncbi:hypothetical protein IKE79_00380 [Candidatus Saccharibacteria bacterium]|nr:hypothetical protein [Candidatus Saccharibacteria bacterium]
MNNDGEDDSEMQKVTVIDTGIPTIPEQITGNYFGYGRAKQGTRWVFVILSIGVILSVFVYGIMVLATVISHPIGKKPGIDEEVSTCYQYEDNNGNPYSICVNADGTVDRRVITE